MPIQRTQRKARKLDRAKATEQAGRGMTTPEIAQLQNLAPSTVFRFLRQSTPEREALEVFKKERGDVFARLAAKSLSVQERIVDTFDDALINALPVHQKGSLLHTLAVSAGILFDKERLERGQSSQNLAVLGRLIVEAESRLGVEGKATEPLP